MFFTLSKSAWLKELVSADYVDELGLGMEDFGDSGGDPTFPARTGDEKSASVIAGGAGAQVVEVKAIEVHHLEDPVAILLYRRNGEDRWARREDQDSRKCKACRSWE